MMYQFMKTFKSVTMKQHTFHAIKSSLFSVDGSFFKLLYDGPWIFDGSWLNVCYLSEAQFRWFNFTYRDISWTSWKEAEFTTSR